MATKENLEAVFVKLGMKPSVSTFTDRIKLQKIVYLTERAFGVKLGFSSSFSWYLHGPYSSSLTQVMFEDSKGTPIKLSNQDLEKLRMARTFFKKYGQTADQLELIGSLLHILKITERSSQKIDPISWFADLKPHYSRDKIKEAEEILKKNNLV